MWTVVVLSWAPIVILAFLFWAMGKYLEASAKKVVDAVIDKEEADIENNRRKLNADWLAYVRSSDRFTPEQKQREIAYVLQHGKPSLRSSHWKVERAF